jgi:hypothetical protein
MNTPKSSSRRVGQSRVFMIHDVAPVKWTPRRASLNQPGASQASAVVASAPRVSSQRRLKKPSVQHLMQWLKKYGLIVAALIVVIGIVRLSAAPSVSGPIIAAYAIGVFMLRISSRVTFGLAFLALIGVVIELLLLPEADRVNNGALLVFLLLGVALVSSVFETRRLEAKNKISRRR